MANGNNIRQPIINMQLSLIEDDKEAEIVKLSLAALMKHMAVAGMGYINGSNDVNIVKAFYRFLGFFLIYRNYLKFETDSENGEVYDSMISIPFWFEDPLILMKSNEYIYDPTEKVMLSNLIGKAVADYLVKNKKGAIFTTTYEHELVKRGCSLNGSRPDLIAFMDTNGKAVSVEAKGLSKLSKDIRDKAKRQARSIPECLGLGIESAWASITYDIYGKKSIKSLFIDPSIGDYDKRENNRKFLYESLNRYYRKWKKLIRLNILEKIKPRFELERKVVEFIRSFDFEVYKVNEKSIFDIFALAIKDPLFHSSINHCNIFNWWFIIPAYLEKQSEMEFLRDIRSIKNKISKLRDTKAFFKMNYHLYFDFYLDWDGIGMLIYLKEILPRHLGGKI